MKRKAIEQLTPKKTRKNGMIITVQQMDNILILNVYSDKEMRGRYCIDTITHEYESWNAEDEMWHKQKLMSLLDPMYEPYTQYFVYYSANAEFNSKEEQALVDKLLDKKHAYCSNTFDCIERREIEFGRDRREHAENRRINRVNTLMSKIPNMPSDIDAWILKRAAGEADYAFFDKESGKWTCTACKKTYAEKYLKREDGEKKVRHNDMAICPRCKKIIRAKRRGSKKELATHFMLLQSIDSDMSVARHFDVAICWSSAGKTISMSESIRFLLYKNERSKKKKKNRACDIFYNQHSREWELRTGTAGWFDNKSNRRNRRTYTEYLYEKGIESALQETEYEEWARLFGQLARAGKKLAYNWLMATQNDKEFISVIEYLSKGRYNRLLQETSEHINTWSLEYCGPLYIRADTIEGIFGIDDRQKINRIRDLDGGEDMLEWMRWSDESGEKIAQDTLTWLTANKIKGRDIEFIEDQMSLTKIMNYVKRQQEESYKGKSARDVLSQWADYLRMCTVLKRHTDDEMIYKPRELKRRHDEAVAEIAAREAELQADEYSRRFPDTERVLAEIKDKYAYEGEKYLIFVPEKVVDIVLEGRALHHCAGSTDRYFDRIAQQETYICFLRKKEAPETPYYTIEVEPGGTIRQHRGYLDEEPEIEEVKPFLREWQKVIKKRMTKQDHQYAAASKVKREENIEELKVKNNTRVLEGLIEDFMEAM